MSYVDWKITTKRLATCSCDYGCPCEFNALPSRVPCEGVEAMEIVRGHFGDVTLDALRFGSRARIDGLARFTKARARTRSSSTTERPRRSVRRS